VSDRPEGTFGDLWPADRRGYGQDLLLDFRRQPKHPNDLRDPGTSDVFPTSDLRLVCDLAGVDLASPFLGLAKQLDDPRGPGLPSGSGSCTMSWRYPFGRHPTRHGPNFADLERAIGSEGDVDGLLLISVRTGAVYGGVSNPEPDLRCDGVGGISKTVTFGEPLRQAPVSSCDAGASPFESRGLKRDARTSRTCNQQDAIEYLQEKNRVLRKAIPRPIQTLVRPAIGCYPRFV
jgi:hypothetical protein